MRRKLTTLRAKQGHSQNGAPRTLNELAFYYEFLAFPRASQRFDSEYSGYSNPSRPRDQAMSLRQPIPRINQG